MGVTDFLRFGIPDFAARDSFDGEDSLSGRAMSQPRDDRQDDLFRPQLEEIINLRHPLVRLAAEIDWDFLAGRFSSVCRVGPGQPPLPTRLVAGLFILKHMHNLSDEALCERWVENPYFQYFCGEVVFRHELPFDRSSLTRWRQRLGEEQIVALLQESLSVAHRIGGDREQRSGARGGGHHRPGEGDCASDRCAAHPPGDREAGRTGQTRGVELRQSYLRVAKRAAIMVGRYTHAHQFKRARRELKFLRTRLGRIIRDIRRKIGGDGAREDRFGPLLDLALRVRHQEQRQRGPKVYSLHAPEVECIGRGKARTPYEFGCKVSIATPATAPKGGQFVLHAKALHGNPPHNGGSPGLLPGLPCAVYEPCPDEACAGSVRLGDQPTMQLLAVIVCGIPLVRLRVQMYRRDVTRPRRGKSWGGLSPI